MASGDIALTVPKSISSLQLTEFTVAFLPSPYMTFTAIVGEFTKISNILFGAVALTPVQRRTSAIQALVTDGINVVAGTLG